MSHFTMKKVTWFEKSQFVYGSFFEQIESTVCVCVN